MPPRPPAETTRPDGVASGWLRFWFTPADTVPLHALRVLTGLLVAVWLLSFVGRYVEWYSVDGLVDPSMLENSRDFNGSLAEDRLAARFPRPSWSPVYMARGGTVHAIYWGGLAAAVLFAGGVATRVTGVLTWLTVVSFSSNPVLLSQGCESLLLFTSFYLMIGFLFLGADRLQASGSLALFGQGSLVGALRRPEQPSMVANLTVRTIQVHTAIALVALALVKLQSSFWWEGLALWFPLHPPASLTLEGVQQSRSPGGPVVELGVLGLAAYLTIAWQLCFPLFAWKKPLLAAAGGVVGMLFVSAAYRLPVLGPSFLICTLAFLPATTWRNLLGRIWAPADPSRRLSD